jgi:hypothetical protein
VSNNAIISTVDLGDRLFMDVASMIVNFGKGHRNVARPPGDTNITDP